MKILVDINKNNEHALRVFLNWNWYIFNNVSDWWKVTYYKNEWGKTKERTIQANSVEYKEQYILVTDINWATQAIKNFNNLIVEEK